MNDQENGSDGRSQRLDSLIAEYLKSVEEGKPLDRQELLARHPDLAVELAAFFADRDRFEQAAGPLRVAAADTPTIDGTAPRPTGPGTMVRYFGDYELLEEIARGGMGVVYKARQVNLKRIVALKLILAGQLAGPQDIARFHAEAEAAAKLDHPGIVPIFEVGQHEGQYYFSMAFVDGESLAHRVAQGVMEPREAARLMRKVAEAIAYAHLEGVIHRDLKPGNILLASGGRQPVGDAEQPADQPAGLRPPLAKGSLAEWTPRITDFGLAKRVEGESQGLTATGQVLGTPSYMPPEQAAGDSAKIGPLADVYSLGAVLYCLLTGRPPFQAASAVETLLQVMTRDPVSPRQLNPAVPRDLETISLKCLDKEPARRYQSARKLADDLQRYLNMEPILARPVGKPQRLWRWCRRQPVVASLSAAVVLALLAGSVFSTWFGINASIERGRADANAAQAEAQANEAESQRVRANTNAARAEVKAKEAEAENVRAEAETIAAQRHLYLANMNLAEQAWEQNNISRLRQLLEDTQESPHRGFEWYYWQRQTHLDLKTFRGHSGSVVSVAFSADGKRIATGSEDRTAKVWEFASGRELLTIKGHSDAVRSVAFSPDGKRIVTGSSSWNSTAKVWEHGTAKVWDAATGRDLLTLTGGGTCVAFSPDSQRVVSGSMDVKVWDAASGQDLFTLKSHTESICTVAFSPDGQRIITGSRDGNAKVWEAASGRELLTLQGHRAAVGVVVFRPDGQRLVTGGYDPMAKVWEVGSGTGLHTLRGHGGEIVSAAFSPDGLRVVTGSEDRTAKVWELASGRELLRELLTLKGHSDAVRSVAFSPDCKRIATGSEDGTGRVWEAETGRELLTLEGHRSGVWSVAFSPDSQRIVAGRADGTGKVWEAATGRELLTLRGHSTSVFSAACSPDGQWVVTGSHDQTAKVWEAATARELLTLKGHKSEIWSVAFSPDNQRIVTGSADGTAKVWDAATGQELLTLRQPGHGGSVDSVAFSPDGERIVTGSGDPTFAHGRVYTAKVWDATTGQELLTLAMHGDRIRSVAFSPDGKRIVTGSYDDTATVWEAARPEQVAAWQKEEQAAGY